MSDLIWHYTSENTLIQLLGRKDCKDVNYLYASHYKFCNDSKEIILGLNIVKRLFSGDKNEIINEKLKKIGKEKLEMICNNLSIIILRTYP